MAKVQVELNVPGVLKDEPLFYQIIKGFDLLVNIHEASFSTAVGWAIITLDGEDKEIKRLFEFLKENNIQVTSR